MQLIRLRTCVLLDQSRKFWSCKITLAVSGYSQNPRLTYWIKDILKHESDYMRSLNASHVNNSKKMKRKFGKLKTNLNNLVQIHAWIIADITSLICMFHKGKGFPCNHITICTELWIWTRYFKGVFKYNQFSQPHFCQMFCKVNWI